MSDEIDLPENFPDYSEQEYWDQRYASEPEGSYDWLVAYSQLRGLLLPRLQEQWDAEILVLGCGNSRFSEELYTEGFKNITNVDFSPILIKQMESRYSQYEEMEFTTMNACNLQFPANCFNAVIDKCTLDCVLCGEHSFNRATAML